MVFESGKAFFYYKKKLTLEGGFKGEPNDHAGL
jgi:hypothetical protein